MDYEYKCTQENGDATCNYDIIANYPIPFEEFYKNILKHTNSFRVEFSAMNERYGGWWKNIVELNKYKDDKNFYMSNANLELWEKFKKETVASCRANGGWGQMTYYVTFTETEVDNA